ncbi:MAG: insulinase family protein [Kofleriaceae bacterium]|nr:insulinase family protein [Kofleriaceae bacterium]MCB9571317.1 insulinase family protein [Kofleriaceae bacterium]
MKSATTLTAGLAAVLALAACGPATKPVPAAPPAPRDVVADQVGGTTTGQMAPPPKEIKVATQTAAPQALTFPDDAFRAAQPEATKPRPFNLPKIKPFKLKSGVLVYLVEQHTLPLVSLDLNFDGGSIADPAGKEGLSSVCMSMMAEGTEQLDKVAFAEALADVAGSVDAYAGADSQGVSMASLTKHLDAVFPLFADTILHPGFRSDDLERMVKRRLESLRQAKGSAPSIVGRVNGPVLYGPQHAYGRLITEASLKAITLDDCKAYHARWVKPGGARLFVVGDLTEAQVRQLFDGDALAAWKGKVPTAPKPTKPAGMKGRIFFVDVPGAKQSQILAMEFGPQRNAKDYFETAIMSSVLGGGFSSRINMNLREDKGYSYGARAGFQYSKYYGVFGGGSSVVSESTYQSLLELANEITAMQSGKVPATAEELSREKAGAIQSMPARFATANDALGTFRSLVYYGLPLDYYRTYVGKVDKVTAKQVAAAAKKHLKPDQLVYVVVGDAKAPMIYRDGKEDKPLMKDGKQLTLLDALHELADTGKLGKGGLVVLDADAKVLP